MPRINYEPMGTSGGGGGSVDSVSESGSSPLTISPTTGNVLIAMSQSDTSTDGWLSSTDWNTFNDKASSSHTHLKIGDANTYIEVIPGSPSVIKLFVDGIQRAQW